MNPCLKRRIIEVLFLFRQSEVRASFLTKRANSRVNGRPTVKGNARITRNETAAFLKGLAANHVVHRIGCGPRKAMRYRLKDRWQSVDEVCAVLHIS